MTFKEVFNGQCDPVLLFDTFINHLLYADGLIMMSNSAKGLQICIHNLEEYCRKWHLSINAEKTKIIIFKELGKILRSYAFVHKNKKTEIVQSLCYLGVKFLLLRGKANKTGSKNLRQAYQQVRGGVYHMIRNLRKTYHTRKIEENKRDRKST